MKRKHFIKDLYNSNKVLENFKTIEFESFQAFYNVFENNIYTIIESQYIRIPIKKEDIENISKLLTESYLCDKTNVELLFNWEDYISFVKQLNEKLAKKTFTIILENCKENLEYLYKQNKTIFKIWTQHSPIWLKRKITYQNYKTELNDIISLYNKKKLRFFELDFDYASFDEMTFKEKRELEWRFSQFYTWIFSTTNDKKYDVNPIVVNRKGFNKTLFVTNDLKLYVNRMAFEKGEMLFDLKKHFNDDGESIDFHDLADLRSYMDIRVDYMIPKLKHYNFVDFYQNKKMLGEYIEIPLITQLIMVYLK